jgi:hypothetical protein
MGEFREWRKDMIKIETGIIEKEEDAVGKEQTSVEGKEVNEKNRKKEGLSEGQMK